MMAELTAEDPPGLWSWALEASLEADRAGAKDGKAEQQEGELPDLPFTVGTRHAQHLSVHPPVTAACTLRWQYGSNRVQGGRIIEPTE
jgi:hypothetical protein